MTAMRFTGPAAIGILASLAVAFQNQHSLLAFGWAAIHRLPGAPLAFAPLAIALVALWSGYIGFVRTNIPAPTLCFALYAVAVVSINEILLPSTPFKLWRSQRALDSVIVTNVREEPLRSIKGNPIGIRLHFDATVARTDVYLIWPSALVPEVADPRHILQFGAALVSIEPEPIKSESGATTLSGNVTYRYTFDLMPIFARLDNRTKEPCLVDMDWPGLSHQEFVSALSTHRRVRFRFAITATNRDATAMATAEASTVHTYDIHAMYQGIVSEGRRCAS